MKFEISLIFKIKKEKSKMLVELTYACKMGCSHCMSDCKPNGEHMTLDTLKDTLDFMLKNNILAWNFSGGELFEHPDILEVLKIIEEYWLKMRFRGPLTFATNGRELVRNKKVYQAMDQLKRKYGKKYFIIQVTDDPKYYPDPLSDKEKYWLTKLGAIIDEVPSDPVHGAKLLYPQGRALKNHPSTHWNTNAPKCANCILVAKQLHAGSFQNLVDTMMQHGRVCTPVIAPDGSIKVGESALCPSVASIYDTESEIMRKIRECDCHACTIAWKRLEQTNPLAYQMLSRGERK